MIPIPIKHGVGFTTQEPVADEISKGYRHEQVGRYHNYHVTADCWSWPQECCDREQIIDAFSPNLNKELHVGHLRQLAIATSLSRILFDSSRFVALLGASLGVKKQGLDGWRFWTRFVHYMPQVYYDVLMPQDVIEIRDPTAEEIEKDPKLGVKSEFGPPQVWDGPNGPVIVKSSTPYPRFLYSFHDVVFAKEVGPTHYITGHEQREHFQNLGLGEKHLPMGLVLGEDGKKLKSRDGNALGAMEAIGLVASRLRDMPKDDAMEVAWNILAWNFLQASRETNLKFEVEKWIRPESPGMYITYTNARILSALGYITSTPTETLIDRQFNDFLKKSFTEDDVKLLGFSEYFQYYRQKAIDKLDPAPLANFAHELARLLGAVYEKERIRGGRPEFRLVIEHCHYRLSQSMVMLGMFPVRVV